MTPTGPPIQAADDTTAALTGARTTQLIIRGATTPLQDDDPREIDGIRLHGRFLAGNLATRKYFGRSQSGYHFVKVLADPALAADFDNETTIAAKLTDAPNLPQFTGRGSAMLAGIERPYYAQRLLTGPALSSQLAAGLPADRLLLVASDLACAIRDLADRGLAHGDIKPEHIIDQGRYVLIDFGSARSSNPAEHPTSILNTGTRSYAAPERLRGEAASQASDVFAWGIVMLHAATGVHPLPGGSLDLHDGALDPAVDKLPERWRPLVRATLRVEPAERPTPTDLALAAASLSTPQTAVLTHDNTEAATAKPVVLPRGIGPLAKAVAALGEVSVHLYRLALVAIVALTAWIVYAIVIGGRHG